MAPTDKLKKYAKAKSLGIEGYRQMSDTQLDAAIAKASSPTPAKGKVSAAPVKGKATARGKAPASTTAAKGKATAPAKGKTQTAPATKSAARKPASTATTAAKGKATRQSSTKATPAKRTPVKTQPARGKANTPVAAKRTPAKGKVSTRATAKGVIGTISFRNRPRPRVTKTPGNKALIDIKAIDWTAESSVGRTGKRADVLKALRKFKGDYDKAFAALKDNARAYYKGKTKVEAEHLLRWLIARVAYDFVTNTGQHTPGSRMAYGAAKQSTNGSASKAKATTAVKKATGARQTAKKAPAKPAARSTARKPAAARTTARKPASTRTRATTARKR